MMKSHVLTRLGTVLFFVTSSASQNLEPDNNKEENQFGNFAYHQIETSQLKDSCYRALMSSDAGQLSVDGRIKIMAHVRDNLVPSQQYKEAPAVNNADHTWYRVPTNKEIQISCYSLFPITLKYRGLLPNKIEGATNSRQSIVLNGSESFCYEVNLQLQGRPSATGTYECTPNENDSGVNVPFDQTEISIPNYSAAIHLFVRGDEDGFPKLIRPEFPSSIMITPDSQTGRVVVPCFMDSPALNPTFLHLMKKNQGHAGSQAPPLKDDMVSYSPTVGFLVSNSTYTCDDMFTCYDESLPGGIETMFKVSCGDTTDRENLVIEYKPPRGDNIMHECIKATKVTLVECQSRLECELLKPCHDFVTEVGCHYDVMKQLTCSENRTTEEWESCKARFEVPSSFRGLTMCSNAKYMYTTYILSDIKGGRVHNINFSSGISSPNRSYPRWIDFIPTKYGTWVNVEQFNQYETNRFECRTSKVYGAQGLEWMFESGSGERTPAFITDERVHATTDAYVASATVHFNDTDTKRLICRAPRINSHSSIDPWHEISAKIQVARYLPLIMEGDTIVNVTMSLPTVQTSTEDQEHSIITCQATGVSVKFSWFKNHKPIGSHNQSFVRSGNNTVSSSIQIYYDGSVEGTGGVGETYMCAATDFHGLTVSKQFNIQWIIYHSYFPLDIFILLLSILLGLLGLCGLALLVNLLVKYLKRRWKRQAMRAFRDLYKEFIHGSPAKTASSPSCVLGLELEDSRSSKSTKTTPKSAVLEPNYWDKPFNDKFQIKKGRLHVSEKKLGEGFFGVVYEGQYGMGRHTMVKVAVKQIKLENHRSDLNVARDFQRNQSSFMYWPRTSSRNANLVLEFCENGSIEGYLRNLGDPDHFFHDEIDHYHYDLDEEDSNGSSECGISSTPFEACDNIKPRLNTSELWKWANQIASGMAFLASQRFIHRDLAARNVLLDYKLNAKITDFGLSRGMGRRSNGIGFYQFYQAKSGAQVPMQWLAPETLNTGVFTVESDVWAFGVTLWEILGLCRSEPYEELDMDIKGMSVLTLFLNNGGRLIKPEYASDEMYNLILEDCWNPVPSNRPDFPHLQEVIIKIAKTAKLNTDNYYVPLNRNVCKGHTGRDMTVRKCIPRYENFISGVLESQL